MILDHIEDINRALNNCMYEEDYVEVNAELLKARSIAFLGLAKLMD